MLLSNVYKKKTAKLKAGMRLVIDDGINKETYIIARDYKNRILLICLEDGNCWEKTIEVDDYNDIKEEEMIKIMGDETYLNVFKSI